MTLHDSDPATEIRGLINGYRVTQAIHVAVTLGIADLLINGSQTSDALAQATKTHPPTLYRLLRALASANVLRELEDQRFELTPLGDCLRADAPDSMAGWAAHIGRSYQWQAWTGLLHSVQTGETAFQHIYGTDVWTYRSTRPEESAIFDRAMTSVTVQSSAAVVGAYNFGRFQSIVDIGGGHGALLAGILKAYQDLKGILFDQPHVVAGASTLLEEAGLADRCQIVAGNFFESVPNGADAYVLKAVIHDWQDAESIRILSVIRHTINAEGTLLLIERLIEPPNEGQEAKFSDLNMLVNTSGQERTRAEFAALLEAAGFRLTQVVRSGMYSVLEALPI